jgi:multiple sugar transport system ATP-binding protein
MEIDAKTDVLEPMGDEIFVYLMLTEDADTSLDQTASNDQLLMSVAPDYDISEDQSMDVVLDRSRIHLFDSSSGQAIHHGITSAARAETSSGTEAESDD